MGILMEAQRLGLRWGRPDGSIVSRHEFVAEAREWMHTPFLHQQDMKGVGADCGGLIRGVSVALGLIPANYRDLAPARLRGYSRQPEGDLGMMLCDFYWKRIDIAAIQPADVVLMRWRDGPPQHGGIVGDYRHGGLSLIHALNRGVSEHRLDASWHSRIVAAYSLPGVS